MKVKNTSNDTSKSGLPYAELEKIVEANNLKVGALIRQTLLFVIDTNKVK